MPHLTLEYSTNLAGRLDFQALFSELHQVLAGVSSFKIQDFKSRGYPASAFFIGKGNANQSFINLDIATFGGKSTEERKLLTETALRVLSAYFRDTLTSTSCDISVQVTELERAVFSRLRSEEMLEGAQ